MKTYRFMSIFLFALMLNACDVSLDSPNGMSVPAYWKTETDAENGVNAIYNAFYKPGGYMRWIWFRLDITSDEGFSRSPWASLKEWTQFRYSNYNFSEGNVLTYDLCYQAIFRANQVLHYVPDIAFADVEKKTHLLGQAYFLRGLYYYNLAVLWGSGNKSLAINIEDELPTPGLKPCGHTGTEVYRQAVSDFDKAQGMLPDVWDEADKGRVTKGAALAMKAKCHMQLHEWEEAKESLYWLVEGDGKKYYGLVANYGDNFSSKTENNTESVFEIQYSDVHQAPAGDGVGDMNPNLGQHRGKFFGVPEICWVDSEMRPWVVEEFKKEKNRSGGVDIRLKYTAFYDKLHTDFGNDEKIYGRLSRDQWGKSNWSGRVFIRKYTSSDERNVEDNYNPINIRIVRYADVLLMYAECIAESRGDLAEAVGYVNQVRARANMPDLAVNHPDAASDREQFLKRLQMERVLELATEGHRWADLRRWGLVDTQEGVSELITRDADFANFVVGKHNCLPIPSNEKNNNPNIEQNPNY